VRRMRWRLKLLVPAMLLFVASGMMMLTALEHGWALLMLAAALTMLASAACYVAAAWLPERRVDWERVASEQRLWESGPVGRVWLRSRQRLEKLWKL
jgi:uncharacterized protein (DUF58 family)